MACTILKTIAEKKSNVAQMMISSIELKTLWERRKCWLPMFSESQFLKGLSVKSQDCVLKS